MSQWIWMFGEFEKYHNLLLHSRRQQLGCVEPTVWKLYPTEPVVNFEKTFTTEGGTVRVIPMGECSISSVDTEGNTTFWYADRVHAFTPGTYTLRVRVLNRTQFAAVYVDGAVESDGTWLADDLTVDMHPVGTWDIFDAPEKTPDIFPFSYEAIDCVEKKPVEGGVLFDFGKETFARTEFFSNAASVRIRYGESAEEAMDDVNAIVQMTKIPEKGRIVWEPTAFRYIFVSDPEVTVKAEYEYLPLPRRGAFRCDDEVLNRVWDTAAYTFHLNSREFFLDGIKRDRWVWSADAYQSLFVNHYLFMDPEIEKRTLIALSGGKPFKRHINTIVDYTFFWFISVYEYYRTYGDVTFLRQMQSQMEEIMSYLERCVSEDGLVRGRDTDWIFIDWAPMDKTGALLGEQVLFAKALECYGNILEILGEDGTGYKAQGAELQKLSMERFYDPEKRVFIDSYESGKRYVTRQNNILAYLFLPISQEQKNDIYERVILNPEIRPITTPYFTFYENQVHCLHGQSSMLEEAIRGYYGKMLETGATSLYEEFDPNMRGAEHYAMYGFPFGKSLCHAWSASPIYLLGAFRMGVRNTGIAYETFEVCPNPGDLKWFDGIVPLPKGDVRVTLKDGKLSVLSDAPGGTVRVGGQTYPLSAGEQLTLDFPI